MSKYILFNLAVLSILLNTLTGGSYRNTFSARVGYSAFVLNSKWAPLVATFIDRFFGVNHCYNEYLHEKSTF